jgi:hypothetical protein
VESLWGKICRCDGSSMINRGEREQVRFLVAASIEKS